MDLTDRWPLPDRLDVRDRVLAAYADPARGYHDTRHLGDVLDRLDELAAAGAVFDEVTVRLAAWFHDAVHDGGPDDEARSAQWAQAVLPGQVGDAVARLVRMTAEHRPDDDDADACALSDADLAVLAADRERYDDYVASVRREYADVPDEAFRQGRAAVLRALADKPHLFHTAHARAHWERAARVNLAAELEQLSPGGPA